MSLTDETRTTIGHDRSVDIDRGLRIGPYRLIRELGRGGMGSVYLGVRDDDVFQKRVAIKILKRGMDTDAIVRRFRHERQILAGLEHQCIAGLLDGGTTPEGLPYFAMEYVEGQTIVEYCESRHLDTTARVKLFQSVCSAVQYAHQNLIIHRDIKPANVLVTSDGTPKLLDFGIAKLLNPELSGQTFAPTAAGLQLMTPEYASPEQVRGEAVTTATDVYSLGVLLYELLTGRLPYRLTSRAPADIARAVCDSVPLRPSTAVTQLASAASSSDSPTGGGHLDRSSSGIGKERPRSDTDRLRRRLAGDLDNIVLKALSKEPGRRYASVDQFSEDLRRHLAGLPVIARKDTLGYRTAKFVRRNRAAVAAGIMTFAALIAGIVGTTWQARAAQRERLIAEQRFTDVRQLANSLLFEVHDAVRDLPGSTPARQLLVSKALEYLDKLSRDAGDHPDLQRELASAYLKVGDVQGRPLNPNLGDTAGALESYKKSATIYESLGAHQPGIGARGSGLGDRKIGAEGAEPTLGRELATVYTRLSEILSSTGDTGEALAYARKGLELQRTVTSDASASKEARLELAAAYSRYGDLLSATGDTSDALEQRRTALAMMQTISAASPNDVVTLRQLGVAHQRLGNQLGNPNYPNIGDHEGALEQLQQSTEIFRRATTLYPTNAMFRRNLAVATSNLADVLQALGRFEEALAQQRGSYSVFEELAAVDPTNVAARNDLAVNRSKLAERLDMTGRTREALREYEAGMAIHQAMIVSDPENDSLKWELASDANRVATAQAKLGERAPSLANHTRAITMARELTAANPQNIEMHVGTAMALTGRGDAYALSARRNPPPATRAKDLANAERDYAEAVELLSKLQQDGAIEGTDVELLETYRAELDKLRQELGRTRP